MPWLLLFGGLIILSIGAHFLVKGGAALALRLGLPPLVIGLTVMAYGTSSPEVVVSAQAASRDSAAIAIGNVIGSNVCNIALILGLCALIRPLTAAPGVIRREVPVMIVVALVAAAFLLNGRVEAWEGVLLLVGLVAYTVATVWQARREAASLAAQEYSRELGPKPTGFLMASVLTLAGLGLLVLGSDLFVDGAVQIARTFGLSEVVIGLTVVAIGTSLPELATSFVAGLKGDADVAIGNIVGSNIFNVLGILGLVGLLDGGTEEAGLKTTDLVMLVVISLALLPLVRSGGRISRLEGAGLLVVYIAYTAWMIVTQTS